MFPHSKASIIYLQWNSLLIFLKNIEWIGHLLYFLLHLSLGSKIRKPCLFTTVQQIRGIKSGNMVVTWPTPPKWRRFWMQDTSTIEKIFYLNLNYIQILNVWTESCTSNRHVTSCIWVIFTHFWVGFCLGTSDEKVSLKQRVLVLSTEETFNTVCSKGTRYIFQQK